MELSFWGEKKLNRVMVHDEESSSETATSSQLLRTASTDSSAESSFRELDDAFLQTQARIWLGEVLQIRLDEELIISELLADGELLFQVSEVVWKMLLAKHKELRHVKAYKSKPFTSERNSGRYRPYSNVDSFLKICKVLGLTGVDLFSPSDVVEKRNTRRVCMCIRSFSKKSRSMSVNVPDFDVVTCKVAMSKDLVGCIRKSIELSHNNLADSCSNHLQNHGRRKSRQDYSVAVSTRDYKTHSENSDDTEISSPVFQFEALHTDDIYDCTSEINYNMPSPTVESVLMPEDLDQQDIQDQQRNEISNDEFELSCSMHTLQCHCSDNLKHQHEGELAWSSSSSCGDLDLIGMTSHSDTRVEQVQESRIMDFDYSENLMTTPVKYEKNEVDPDLFDEENSTPNLHQSASSHGSNPTPQTIENGWCFDICENMKVHKVADISCLTREALNLGDQFDAENNFKNIESFKFLNDKNDQREMVKEHGSQDIMKCKEMSYGIASNTRNSHFIKKLQETEHSLYSYFCNTNSSDRVVSQNNDIRESQVDLKSLDYAGCNKSDVLLSFQSYDLPELCKWDQKGKCAMTLIQAKDNRSSSCFLEDGSHEEITPCKQKTSEVLMSKVMLSYYSGNNDCLALASNVLDVDDCEKSPTNDTNTLCGKGVTTQDIGNQDQSALDIVIDDVVVHANCDEDVSNTVSYIANNTLKLECNDGDQARRCDEDPASHSEHTCVVKEDIKPECESIHHLENLVVKEEGALEIPKEKPQKKLLLRSVLGGAAAAGLLFMYLHLRFVFDTLFRLSGNLDSGNPLI